MTTFDVDAWELAGFPGRLNVAAYLTADPQRLNRRAPHALLQRRRVTRPSGHRRTCLRQRPGDARPGRSDAGRRGHR